MRCKTQGIRAAKLAGGALLVWVVAAGCGKSGINVKKPGPDAGSGGAGGSHADASTASPSGGTGGSVAADAGVDRSASGGTSLASTGGGSGGGGGASTSRLSASGGTTSSSGGVGQTDGGGLPGSGGVAGATATKPETRDAGVDAADAPINLNGIYEYCAFWTRTVCAIEVDCCRARGFEVSVDWCPVPTPPAYFFQQPICSGKLVPPDGFDNAAAQACIDAQAQLFAGCAPARRDSPAHAAAIASCEQIAPEPLPQSGFCDPDLPCAAPPGMVSVCYYPPGSGGIAECSPPTTPRLEGERCGDEVGCAEGLICGPAGTCTPPLADGQTCMGGAQCRSGYCKDVCGSPPPIADGRCEDLQRLDRYALYMNVGNGSVVTVTAKRLVWLGYYGPHGEYLHLAPKDGSGPVVHLTPEAVHTYANVEPFADDDYLYDIDKGVVGRISLADGSRKNLNDVGFDGHLEARDGNDLVVVAHYCSRMARVSVVDGSVAHHPGQHETNKDSETPYVAVDEQAVYCVNGRRITRFGRNGDFSVVTEAAVSSLGWTTGLQAFGGRLYYWAAGDSVENKGLLRILDLGTGKLSLVTPPSDPTTATASDPGKGLLVWETKTGIQQYAPESGAAVLVQPPVPVGKLTLDEAFFYWIYEDGIYRWPRP